MKATKHGKTRKEGRDGPQGGKPAKRRRKTSWSPRRIFEETCVARLDRKRSISRSLVLTLVVTVIGLSLSSTWLRPKMDGIANDGHALLSLTMAMNWVYCGHYSSYSPQYDMQGYLLQIKDMHA